MMRNDYRRTLILLRSNAQGYSGHVRLERRTLMGTMYFMVQLPDSCETLRAALVGRSRDGNYYACAIGELRRDSRGQAVMGYSFDPRDICGRELEQYQLIAVTCAGDAQCQIALFGNVCGHAEVNWESVRAVLCDLYGGNAEQAAGARREGAQERSIAQKRAPERKEASEDGEASRDAVAGDLLGVDASLPWPDAAEPLRKLFQTSTALKDAPDDQCVYVEAPMPEESGFSFVAAGLLAQGGALAAIRYALPAAWTEEAPAGLEDYAWVGDQNKGWWVTEVPIER